MRWPHKETIQREDGPGISVPYLDRWHLLNTRFGRLYLHRFWRSDDDVFHDHPWWFVSLILRGYYDEVTPFSSYGGEVHEIRRVGSIRYRPATWRHRVMIAPQMRGRVWTLVLTGRKVRQWGFWCPKGWIEWTTHLRRRQSGLDGCP
jgi:hypothetical protein